MAAKSQHRPEERWLVMGEPSREILMLKDWVSAIVAERWVRTVFGSVPARAERARRFWGVLAVYTSLA